MKAIVLTNLRELERKEVPDPTIEKDTDVLLRVERVGVCGSDVHYYETGRVGDQVVEYPFIIGHECSATVKAVGRSVRRVKVGEPVVVDPAASCGQCEQCRMGREHTCYALRFLGTPGQGGGCLCEYLVMPEECCFPTRGRINLEQAALCEPLSIGVYAVKRAAMANGASVGILGAGPIGLSVLAAAKAENAGSFCVTDKIDARLDAAKAAGADRIGNPDKDDIVGGILGSDGNARRHGLDVVFECCGQQDALDQAVEVLRPGGKLIIVGIPREQRVSFVCDRIRRKEIDLVNIRRQNHCVQPAIDLIAEGRAEVDYMITHRFEFEKTKEAFDLVAAYGDGVIKAMIEV